MKIAMNPLNWRIKEEFLEKRLLTWNLSTIELSKGTKKIDRRMREGNRKIQQKDKKKSKKLRGSKSRKG